MLVLIVTRSDDNACVANVTAALRARGAEVARFDTDRFPGEVRLVLRSDPGRDAVKLVTAERTWDLARAGAVWHRRFAAGRRLPATLDPQLRAASIGEARAVALGTIASLDAYHLDRVVHIRAAEQKPWHLRLAREAGLDTPRTVVTNDASAVRAFAAECPGGIVTKMMTSFAIREPGREKVVFTTALEPEELDRLEGLELCPMTFQERLPKAIELRVTVVGRRLFVAAVDSAAVAGAGDDWRRRGDQLENAWRAHRLPSDVEHGIGRLMDALRLDYGALDFILTPEGRWVFLEINPAGEYFWLDDLFTPTISESIAEILIGRAQRRGDLRAPELIAGG